ncbi:MAG: sulfatase [Akkermansiaceae bacterium]|jgi:arylsulfatase A-like enzyme|nr:sulfatase [Akkermansiaceae bacterium]
MHLPILLSALLALPATVHAAPPNIVLIYVDDLGYGDLGCYGSEKNDTPHIDRLAREGMRFTDYYSASSVCTPSRASLLTGCYPGRVGFDVFGKNGNAWVLFPGYAEGLHPDERTLPELLQDKGYATCHIGKWHLGDQPEHLPTRHGFDSYYGIPYSNDMCRTVKRKKYTPMPLLRNETVIQQQPTQAALIERYTEEAVSFLRANRSKPFFLYLAHLHVHLPHYVMEPFASQSRNGRYGAALAAVDWSTGALVAELDHLGLADNTIVIFTSDNGSRARGEGGSNGPLRGHKGQTWEGGMRVPCIVKWPAKVPKGTVRDELVAATDFYPTLAALAGHDPATLPKHDGVNLLPVWRGENPQTPPRREFFYFKRGELQAVRAGQWKLRHAIETGGKDDPSRLELFDLAAEPGETRDLAAEHPDIVARLSAAMTDIRAKLGDTRLGIQGSERRPPAISPNPKPLTTFDPEFPYIEPAYLLDEAG